MVQPYQQQDQIASIIESVLPSAIAATYDVVQLGQQFNIDLTTRAQSQARDIAYRIMQYEFSRIAFNQDAAINIVHNVVRFIAYGLLSNHPAAEAFITSVQYVGNILNEIDQAYRTQQQYQPQVNYQQGNQYPPQYPYQAQQQFVPIGGGYQPAYQPGYQPAPSNNPLVSAFNTQMPGAGFNPQSNSNLAAAKQIIQGNEPMNQNAHYAAANINTNVDNRIAQRDAQNTYGNLAVVKQEEVQKDKVELVNKLDVELFKQKDGNIVHDDLQYDQMTAIVDGLNEDPRPSIGILIDTPLAPLSCINEEVNAIFEKLEVAAENKDMVGVIAAIEELKASKEVNLVSWLNNILSVSILTILNKVYSVDNLNAVPFVYDPNGCIKHAMQHGWLESMEDIIFGIFRYIFAGSSMESVIVDKNGVDKETCLLKLIRKNYFISLPWLCSYRACDKTLKLGGKGSTVDLDDIIKQAFDKVPTYVIYLDIYDLALNKFRVYRGPTLISASKYKIESIL